MGAYNFIDVSDMLPLAELLREVERRWEQAEASVDGLKDGPIGRVGVVEVDDV